jgi:hypothetical protein
MELECLQRLIVKTSCQQDITAWLVAEKLLTKEAEKAIYANKSQINVIYEIHKTLQSLRENDKVQLLDYMWNILPVEQIRITIVSDNERCEFTHGI